MGDPEGGGAQDPLTVKFKWLRNLQKSAQKSQVCARLALEETSRPEQQRALRDTVVKMGQVITILQGHITALLSEEGDGVRMPTPDEIAATKDLLIEVEGLTNQNLTAASALSVSTRVLTMAGEFMA